MRPVLACQLPARCVLVTVHILRSCLRASYKCSQHLQGRAARLYRRLHRRRPRRRAGGRCCSCGAQPRQEHGRTLEDG